MKEIDRKAGRLGTDFNHNIMWKHIAIDELWSALRSAPPNR